MKKSTEEVIYSDLVERICRKIVVNQTTTKLKLSYFPLRLESKKPSYILDDEDVFGYLMNVDKDQRRSLLFVELIEDVQENQNREYFSGDNRRTEVDGRFNSGGAPDRVDEVIVNLNTEVEPLKNCEFTFDAQDTHYRNHAWKDSMDLTIGQEFESIEAMKDLVDKASHQNCFEIVIVKSCPSLYLTTTSTSKIRRKGTRRLVASVLHEEYPGQFNTPTPKDLIGMVQGKLGVKVSYSTALRGRKLAIDDVRGNPEESYQTLHSYLYMLEKMNHGTKTCVELDVNQRFKYLFITLGACIEGFKAMRKVIIVDGTFLKTKYGGVLIVATAQDPDYHHYPIAFGVVDGEKDASWMWFMNMLKTVIPDDPELVFLSDRNGSIIKAISEVYKRSQHGYCMYHLSQNVKSSVHYTKKVNKESVAEQFRECARAYTEFEFKKLYGEFRIRYPTVAEYLDRSVEEQKWARCYFPGERYNIDNTNCAESINSVFKNARKYSILRLLDAIIEKVAEWFNKHRKSSAEGSLAQKLVPYVEGELHTRYKEAKFLPVQELNNYMQEYSVMGSDNKRYLVDLARKTCSCKCFDIDKYPCVHGIDAAGSITDKEIHIHELCSKYYLMEIWALAYYRTIYHVPHKSEWVVPDEVKSLCILPPPCIKKRGRVQEARFPSVGERGRRDKKKKNSSQG